jgi:hypothetical protein
MYEAVNPEIPGLDGSNPGISGLRKSPGSRNPGIAIPSYTLIVTMGANELWIYHNNLIKIMTRLLPEIPH